MVARVTTVKVKPEDIDEAVRLFEESVIPPPSRRKGSMGALLLTREDGRGLVIDLCDTLEHMRANEHSGFYQSEVAKFAGKIVDHPSRAFFSVAVARACRAARSAPRAERAASARRACRSPCRWCSRPAR